MGCSCHGDTTGTILIVRSKIYSVVLETKKFSRSKNSVYVPSDFPCILSAQIDTLEVTQFSHFHPEQVESLVNAGLYPPRVSYVVHHTDAHALNPVPLKCRIDVKGVEINGKPLYFMLTSPPQMITTDKPCKCTCIWMCL